MSLVEISNKLMDLPFISRVIRTRRLDPMPHQDFYLDPKAWSENGAFKRTVEQYNWGCVIFLSNLALAQHFTVVAFGDFAPASGLLAAKAPRKEQLRLATVVPWYLELARSLGGKQVPQVEINIPPCLGYHEDDANTDNPICDGGYIATKNVTERPCAWKPNCIALQGHCGRLGQLPAEVLKDMGSEKIIQLTTRLREDQAKGYAPQAQVLATTQAAVKHTVALAKPKLKIVSAATAVPQKATSAAGNDELQLEAASGTGGAALLLQVWKGLQARISRNFVANRDLAAPGDIFIQDRSRSGYVSLYCEPAGGRRIAIVEIKLKADKIHALFPIAADDKLLAGSEAKPAADGKFISIVSNIPSATFAISKLVDVLAKAIDTGAIPLPKL